MGRNITTPFEYRSKALVQMFLDGLAQGLGPTRTWNDLRGPEMIGESTMKVLGPLCDFSVKHDMNFETTRGKVVHSEFPLKSVHYALYCLSLQWPSTLPLGSTAAHRRWGRVPWQGDTWWGCPPPDHHMKTSRTWTFELNGCFGSCFVQMIPCQTKLNQQILALIFCHILSKWSLNDAKWVELHDVGGSRRYQKIHQFHTQRLRARQRWPTSPWCWRWPGAIASFSKALRHRAVNVLKMVHL